MARLVPDSQSIRRVLGRMNRMLMGNDAGPDGPIRTATLIAAISGTAMSPLAVGLDDDSLRAQLLHLALTFLEIPD